MRLPLTGEVKRELWGLVWDVHVVDTHGAPNDV